MDFNAQQTMFAQKRAIIRNNYGNKIAMVQMEAQQKVFKLKGEMSSELLKIDEEYSIALAEYQKKRDEMNKKVEQ